jgi:hypothetical protein
MTKKNKPLKAHYHKLSSDSFQTMKLIYQKPRGFAPPHNERLALAIREKRLTLALSLLEREGYVGDTAILRLKTLQRWGCGQ